MEWLKENMAYIAIGIGLAIFLIAYFPDFELKNIFSKYSNSLECEIDKKIELGYEPDLDTQYQIEYFCRKYD